LQRGHAIPSQLLRHSLVGKPEDIIERLENTSFSRIIKYDLNGWLAVVAGPWSTSEIISLD
jgi:hypothetical protein